MINGPYRGYQIHIQQDHTRTDKWYLRPIVTNNLGNLLHSDILELDGKPIWFTNYGDAMKAAREAIDTQFPSHPIQTIIERRQERIADLEAALHTSLEWTNELVAGRDARIKILEDAWHDLEAISLEYYHSLGIDKKENDRANEILDRLAHYKRILEGGK